MLTAQLAIHLLKSPGSVFFEDSIHDTPEKRPASEHAGEVFMRSRENIAIAISSLTPLLIINRLLQF